LDVGLQKKTGKHFDADHANDLESRGLIRAIRFIREDSQFRKFGVISVIDP